MKSNTTDNQRPSMSEENSSTSACKRRLLTKDEVLLITGLKNTTLYKLINLGEFPIQVKRGRRSFWWDNEVDRYMNSLPRARR